MKVGKFNTMDRLNLPEKIESDRLLILRLRYEDAEEIFYTYASKEEATRFVSWPTHQSVKDTHQYLRYAVKAWNAGVDFAYGIRLKETNRLIGSIGIVNDQGKVQFGYVLSPTQWGNGYATEACHSMINVLRKTPGIYRIGTLVDADNHASVRVLQKCGLTEEARLTKWFRFVNQQNEPKDCILFKLEL
ncbi:MAG: GNAT family N-acetyltransferase [Cyclobacteriaceae bacterium]|jgi:ribosomal-protein-alanine N-acetyltransferase|nr:GNAT family N-acetyltransferase [Cyclobacteriaceae bacterium]